MPETLRELLERDAPHGEQLLDLSAPLPVAPTLAQVARVREEAPNVPGDIVGVIDELELPSVGVRQVEALGRDPHVRLVNVELASTTVLELILIDFRVGVGVLGLRLVDLSQLDHLALVVD